MVTPEWSAGRLSFAYATFYQSWERPGKRQLVAVRIGHVEIPFSPRGISWNLPIKSPVFQMIPEGVHIRDVEDQPPPASHGLTLFCASNTPNVADGDHRILMHIACTVPKTTGESSIGE